MAKWLFLEFHLLDLDLGVNPIHPPPPMFIMPNLRQKRMLVHVRMPKVIGEVRVNIAIACP